MSHVARVQRGNFSPRARVEAGEMKRLFAVGALLAALAGWSSSSPEVVVGGEGGASDRFPSETLTDWVSYADQVSVSSVVSEELPESHDPNVNGGYFGRAVAVRIEQMLWRRPGAPSAHGTIREATDGPTRRSARPRLAGIPPDPLAVKYAHLAPEERWHAVYGERGDLDY